MRQITLDFYRGIGCIHRRVSVHNGFAYCYSPDHLTKWGYACYCPPIGCGDPPVCPMEAMT